MKRGRLGILIMICIFLIGVLLFVFLPVKREMNTVIPAVLLGQDGKMVRTTSVEIIGCQTWWRYAPSRSVFTGNLEVRELEAANAMDGWEVEYALERMENKEVWLGTGGFKSGSGDLEAAVVYTNEEFTALTLLIDDYMVVAPASTAEEAQAICEQLGLT